MKKVYLFMMSCLLCAFCYAQSGTDGNINWSISDGTLYISGEGAMKDYAPELTPWREYDEAFTAIRIESGVTAIGEFAFAYFNNLQSVTIASPVTTIEDYAFAHNPGLSDISLPNSLTEIGNSAFMGCSKISSIDIPSSVLTIDDEAFYRCEGLTVFHIPSSVTTIGNGVFSNCYSLTAITVDPENLHYSSENGILFNKEKTRLIQCPTAKNGEVTINNTVETIGEYAFLNCSKVISITIPNSVTKIENQAFYQCI